MIPYYELNELNEKRGPHSDLILLFRLFRNQILHREGGDGITLWQRVRAVTFADAVREMVA